MKGAPLDVVATSNTPRDVMALLTPRRQQIRSLVFTPSCWADVITFSEVNSGPLPLLHTLNIYTLNPPASGQPLDTATDSLLPLFAGAINVRRFILSTIRPQNLNLFAFPNLTTFILSASSPGGLVASDLLDFLEATPTLHTIDIKIFWRIILEDIPRGPIVVLPNVEFFSLLVVDGNHVYDLAARLSCPCAKDTSLAYEISDNTFTIGVEAFPTSVPWNAIIQQYTRSPVEEVTFEVDPDPPGATTAHSLAFQSSDMTVLRLDFNAPKDITDQDELFLTTGEAKLRAFSQACGAIRSHPFLLHIKRLHIEHRSMISELNFSLSAADRIGKLFGSLGRLEELTIHGDDLRIYLAPFFPEFGDLERVFPHVQHLTISDPWIGADGRARADAIVELVKLQHELGKPFEHVTVCGGKLPTGMAERMEQWVGSVDCSELMDDV